MMIRYKTTGYDNIYAVDVLEDDGECVLLPVEMGYGRIGWHGPGNQFPKRSTRDGWNWFDTWEEARAFLLETAEADLAKARHDEVLACRRSGEIELRRDPTK